MIKKSVILGVIVTIMCIVLIGCDIQSRNVNNEIEYKTEQNNTIKLSEVVARKYIDVVNEYENGKKDDFEGELKYELIYFNEDDIPELIVNNLGYFVEIISFKDGEIVRSEPMSYGAWGIAGYTYAEKCSAIFVTDTDMAGAIANVGVMKYDDCFEMVDSLVKVTVGAEVNETEEGYDEIQKYLDEYGGYYYNGQKVDEGEYDRRMNELNIGGELKELTYASKTSSEMITLLENSI